MEYNGIVMSCEIVERGNAEESCMEKGNPTEWRCAPCLLTPASIHLETDGLIETLTLIENRCGENIVDGCVAYLEEKGLDVEYELELLWEAQEAA